ncbi:MAG TPA: hypothetical protein PJ990_01755 [Saprospiraceae bacterium]|nr:hypothetical protein [Saprospiraceae bacterium]
MKAATVHQIKKELETSSPQRVLSLLLRVIKSKTENKELISYLLFDEDNLSGYIADLREDVSELLKDVKYLPSYQVKRSLRKALKFITKYAKYTGAKETEAELLVHLCKLMQGQGLASGPNKMANSIYAKQVEKVEKLIPFLHEELQFDYKEELVGLKKSIKINYY